MLNFHVRMEPRWVEKNDFLSGSLFSYWLFFTFIPPLRL